MNNNIRKKEHNKKKHVGVPVSKGESSRKRQTRQEQSDDCVWTLDEKQRFVTGLSKGHPYWKADGHVNWKVLKNFIGTKTLKQVKAFAKRFNALEHGNTYAEFSTKAAVDVWRQLADKVTISGDTTANVCVPQVLTVIALEPTETVESINPPDFSNIYNYLSAVTRGTEVPALPADDAVVILELLEDLVGTLSKSETLIQREFMHKRYEELREYLNHNDDSVERQYYSSTNPFAIPFDVLEFKSETFDNKPSED